MSSLCELYRFVENRKDPKVWTFTSSDRPIEYNGETYTPITLSRTQAESKSDISRSNLTVNFDLNNPVARAWMSQFLEAIVLLTVFQVEEDLEVGVVWKGRLSSVKPEPTRISLVFESIFTSLRRPGVRARFMRICRHDHYGRGCRLSLSDYGIPGVPLSVEGNVVVVQEAASHPDGWFTSGIIQSTTGEMKFIISHVGNQLTLMQPFLSLARTMSEDGYGVNYGDHYGGVGVVLYPGCNRTKEMCKDKFDNLPNYGGFDWIPLRNPYDGSSLI